MNLKDYVIRDIADVLQYLPQAICLGIICIIIYAFVLLIGRIFKLNISCRSCILHMLSCGLLVTYMYMLIMIVYYSREQGSRIGAVDLTLWSTWGYTLQTHAYFIENIILFIPFGILFPMVFKNWIRWLTIPAGVFISAEIEYIQLLTQRGYCQIDDLVTNTFGAIVGFLIYFLLYFMFHFLSRPYLTGRDNDDRIEFH